MVLVDIPLVGTIDLDEQQIAAIGMVAEVALTKPLKVSEDVWLEVIRRKYRGRYRNVDDPLREALGLPIEGKPVKQYSDESESDARIRA